MTKTPPKIVFLGTPKFAVPILEKLIDSEYRPAAVFCAPDKPVGRQQILTQSLVKVIAQKYNIPVFQPANSHELADTLKTAPHDLIITAAYGLILPKEVLSAPKYGCLNIHPSLLPKYRGPSPIQAAILNGDAETGVTIYKMDEQIDHGAIIAQEKIQVKNYCHSESDEESRGSDLPAKALASTGATRATDIIRPTTPELSEKLSNLGADLLIKTLPDCLAGRLTPQPQDDSQATFTEIVKKEDGLIDWQKSATVIERQIRAFTPWPGSYTSFSTYSLSEAESRVEGSKIKILEADIFIPPCAKGGGEVKKPGEVFLTDANDLAIQTADGALIVKKLQLAGGKPLSVQDFLRGHKNIIGQILK